MTKGNGAAELDLQDLDIKSIANAGTWLTLRHPTNRKPLTMRVKIAGIDSNVYQKKTFELARRRQEETADGSGPARLSAEDIHERNLELVAACVLGWENVKERGQVLEFKGEASAIDLFKRFDWIYEQVNLAIAERANFLPGSGRS